jgi:hypothetical protein
VAADEEDAVVYVLSLLRNRKKSLKKPALLQQKILLIFLYSFSFSEIIYSYDKLQNHAIKSSLSETNINFLKEYK